MTAQTEALRSKTQVSSTLSKELFERVEDYRWSNRINKTSEIVAEAIQFFLDHKAPVATEKPGEEKPAK